MMFITHKTHMGKTNMGKKHKQGIDIDGWIIIDKPAGIGSTPIVGKVKRGLNANKAGHAGTLDPFATGILPIALGMATKTIPFVQDGNKTYIMTLQFGTTTDSLDTDGTIVATHRHRPTIGDILQILPDFMGNIPQTPPVYSAIKINGNRAYDLARSGQQVAVPRRTIRIDNITLLSITDTNGTIHTSQNWNNMMAILCDSVILQVVCGKGTYIRALGRDLATQCGTVGYLTALRRTKVGDFCEKDGLTLANFEKISNNIAYTDNILLSVESSLVGIPVVTVTGNKANQFRNGLKLSCPTNVDIPYNVPLVIATADEIHGLATADDTGITSTRVFYKPVPRRKI